jgi:NAD(P)-dependent dehydrogenase (short-subunit alcohol dehydrogenase family)
MKIFVTGASGRLGAETVKILLQRGHCVRGQFFSCIPFEAPQLEWLPGDFSAPAELDSFIAANAPALAESEILVHFFGPLLWKDSGLLTAFDLQRSFWEDFLVTERFYRFFRERKQRVKIVCFDFKDRKSCYRKILAYAVAKRAQRLWLKSLRRDSGPVRLQLIAFAGHDEARFPVSGGQPLPVAGLASRVADIALNSKKFYHLIT